MPSSGRKKPFLAKAGVQPTSERSTSGAPLEPAAVSNLFCAWSKGTLTYLTLMSLLAASNSLTRALYVGASLVALEVSHQVMVTGPSALVAAVASAAGRRREGEGRHQRGGRYATPHEFSLRVKARVVRNGPVCRPCRLPTAPLRPPGDVNVTAM